MKPIAIVGMACRLPKGLDNIELLLKALRTRFSAIDWVPEDRWSVERYYSSDAGSKGKSYIQRGGFLTQDVKTFDASFFGISPRDAENMDPQQRLLLEVVWEAFENAGLLLPDYAGKSVGVYVGGFMLDHMISQMSVANRSAINQNTAAGMMMTMLSNRISHTFDFRGPSLSIDTACSSSLVAFHYACQDMWAGISETAVVGGSNVMLRPEYPMGMCKGQFLSRDGECKSFDDRADGYGRGEGAAIVLLKPLENALRDGDPIISTVLASGINQDGRTPGISMPSQQAQEQLIRDVCKRYGIDPTRVRYVECHGTGTAIGDPTESGAIGHVYGQARRDCGPVVVGSIKSNIGHLEAAAGVVGVIKGALTAYHRQATPVANLKNLNPQIDLESLNIRVADDVIDLGTAKEEFCVAVNSFGYGGSNAHVILQTPPAIEKSAGKDQRDAVGEQPAQNGFPGLPKMLPITARSAKALAAGAERLAEVLEQGLPLDDVLYTASFKRAHLSERAVVAGHSREELIESLAKLAKSEDSPLVVKGSQPFQGSRKPVLVFTGMGPQWWGMGQELYEKNPIYRNAIEHADSVFQEVAGFSALRQMLRGEEDSQITRTEYAQPANLLIQIGIWEILKSAGVQPGAVVGHSVGELASAYVAGVLNLKDAMTVCYHRSRLQAKCAGTGGMLAVGLGKDKAIAAIGDRHIRVSIAAVNGPKNVTLAGDVNALNEIADQLTAADIFNKKLEVEVPYHSPLMDPILAELKTSLREVKPCKPSIGLYSTVTGKVVEDISYGADYWPRNVRCPVEFAACIEQLLNAGFNTFIEVGPHPVLTASICDCVKVAGKECQHGFTLRRNQPEMQCINQAIMSIFALGCDLEWSSHNGKGQLVKLPNYAWQRETLWNENDRAIQARIAAVEYPMLGEQEAPAVPTFRLDFDHEPLRYLRDHVVSGMAILPAAAYIESMLEFANLQFDDAKSLVIRNLKINVPLILSTERGTDYTTTFEPQASAVTIRSLENGRLGQGQVHVTGSIFGHQQIASVKQDFEGLASSLTCEEDLAVFYQSLAKIGLQYERAFQTLKELRKREDGSRVLAKLAMQPELTSDLHRYHVHPTLLDGCFQSLIAMLGDRDVTFLPTGFDEMVLYHKHLPESLWCYCEQTSRDDKTIVCDLTLFNDAHDVLATIQGMRLTAATKKQRVDQFGDIVKRQILKYEWTYGEMLSEPKRLGHWLVVGQNDELSEQVASSLERIGATIGAIMKPSESAAGEGRIIVVSATCVSEISEALKIIGDLDGIVFLPFDKEGDHGADPTGQKALESLVSFSQALVKFGYTNAPRCYIVTQQAFSVNESDSAPLPRQTALNGFARVAFNELEGFRFTTVDVPSKLRPEVIENLAMELVCDDGNDEVALRGSLRMITELVDSQILEDDRVETGYLDDQHPIVIRSLRKGVSSVGTARVLATTLKPLGEYDVCLRVEYSAMPTELLSEDGGVSQLRSIVPVVGKVIALGAKTNGFQIDERVCGFAPFDIASHIVGNQSEFILTAIPNDFDGARLVTTLEDAVRAEHAVSGLELTGNEIALVFDSPLGRRIKEALCRHDVRVTLVGDEKTSDLAYCPLAIANAVKKMQGLEGFHLLAANLSSWNHDLGLLMLADGGLVIDMEDVRSSINIPPNVLALVRTASECQTKNARRFKRSLIEVMEGMIAGRVQFTSPLLVSVSDLAWQKLLVADSRASLALSFDTGGKDLPIVQEDNLEFCANATYLITGGFGGFGRKTAEWLVANGARHLVLTGRTGADSPERLEMVRTLEDMGAEVKPVACDTSDLGRLNEVLADITNEMPPLKGIFHSGAVIIDQPIDEIDLVTLDKVMQSKAQGAWNLHIATANVDLDHFVMYSSMANLIGNSRQAVYSAANGFLNGLAEYRQRLGLPGLSVQWGAIADVGVVAKDEKLEQFLRYTGLRGLKSDEGLGLLKIALARNTAQFGVTIITNWSDWARFEVRGGKSPKFATLISADTRGKDTSIRDSLSEELQRLDIVEQLELLTALITEIIASVLKADATTIPQQRAINQLGVDSLMATEIQLLLDSNLGVSISILELLGDTSIQALATKTLKSLFG